MRPAPAAALWLIEWLRGPLPLTAALAYAAAVARALGQLHSEGLTHGNIAPAAIRLTPNGVILLPPSGRAQLPCRCEDVSAFGALLGEMLTCSHSAGGRVHEAASRLAAGCLASREAAADICKLSIQLRVLQLQARVLETQGAAVPPRPEPELNTPAPSAPVKCLPVLEDVPRAFVPGPFEECPRCIGPVFPSSPCSVFCAAPGGSHPPLTGVITAISACSEIESPGNTDQNLRNRTSCAIMLYKSTPQVTP